MTKIYIHPGYSVVTSVTVKNTGIKHRFGVSTKYNQKGKGCGSLSLEPKETKTTEFRWDTPSDLPLGTYELVGKVWKNPDCTGDVLDKVKIPKILEVINPKEVGFKDEQWNNPKDIQPGNTSIIPNGKLEIINDFEGNPRGVPDQDGLVTSPQFSGLSTNKWRKFVWYGEQYADLWLGGGSFEVGIRFMDGSEKTQSAPGSLTDPSYDPKEMTLDLPTGKTIDKIIIDCGAYGDDDCFFRIDWAKLKV